MSALGTAGGNDHTVARQVIRTKETRDAWRERLDIGQIMGWLERVRTGEIAEVNSTQIKAVEIQLDRLLPRLSAVEQTEVNELDQLSRDQILERIQALLKADPTLLPELVGLQAREVSNGAVQTVVKPPSEATGKV